VSYETAAAASAEAVPIAATAHIYAPNKVMRGKIVPPIHNMLKNV
jgi:hypothetical protein